MSHIIDFKVDGLAGRSETFSRTLDRHTNIFFGLNGCGKTSLLKILHSAMSNDASILTRVPFKSASVTIYSIQFKRNFVRTIEKVKKEGQEISSEEEREIRMNERGQLMSAGNEPSTLSWVTTEPIENAHKTNWHHQYLPTNRLLIGRDDLFNYKSFYRSEGTTVSEEQIDLFFAYYVKQLWIKYTSNLVNDIRIAQEAGLASILRAVLSPPTNVKNSKISTPETHQAYLRMKKFVSRQGTVELISSEEDFKKRYNEDIILRQVVQDIDKTEQQIEESSAPRNRLEDLFRNLLSSGKVVVFSEKSIDIETTEGEEIGLSSLSSGEKHVLRLLVETVLADESSIIVDEPELSLHIDWQRDLVKMMHILNPKAQLILATHSPEVMANIPDKFITRM